MDLRRKKLARNRKRASRELATDYETDVQEVLQEMNERVKENNIPNAYAIDNLRNQICFDECSMETEDENVETLHESDENHTEAVDNEEACHLNAETDSIEMEELREWAINSNITHQNLDALLCILRKRLLPDLPKSAKTFLKTNDSQYHIREMEDCIQETEKGEFIYFGISVNLERHLAEFHEGPIYIIVNVDGLPLTRSGKKTFWPILCKIFYHPDIYKPFTVAIYSGNSKPKNLDEYFNDFITEINYLQKEGLIAHGKRFDVILKCVVADTPARAYCKGTKGHGGYSACERCEVYGKQIKIGKGSRVVYPGINYPKRTNTTFRDRRDPEHHVANSPLEEIIPHVDMTMIFPLDFMHLACIGVMKKILELLLHGPLKMRLPVKSRKEMSRRMESIKAQVPVEFQRKPRSLDCLPKWKATEFRFFLLYCGPIIFKGILPTPFLKHFLLLHCAFRILSSENLIALYKDRAKRYLNSFVQLLPLLYGEAAQVMNMHNLTHIVDDVEYLGCDLSKINCFPFENHLGKIKKSIRTANKPLVQFCRRQSEKYTLPHKPIEFPSRIKINKIMFKNQEIIVSKLTFNFFFTITVKHPDNVVLLANGHVMEIRRIYGESEEPASLLMEGKLWRRKGRAFKYPLGSSSLGMFKILCNPGVHSAVYPVSCIEKKLVKLKLTLKPQGTLHTYVIGMLHV